ncbi:MarR family winged helix-turn-helix transcriptional regulator [Pseudomonas rustica]|jgi:DNA-binding MarR family transcriptional regulator|uniref:MarR family winged helix-turn-helix transcriptional regulator n=1 Tax=Pseudomonas rustica TaxID=2827099 RepID=UPI001BAEF213|nr:MarR family transcriptional regulator [Pseudomonas rustica]MBS4089723.1 MarR family transcriptional regulator [Pseudomonas rustica]
MANFSAASFKTVHLGILLGQTAALKDRLLDRHLLPLGITAAQLKVLRIVGRGDDTAVALCRHLSIHSASMTRMLDRLERKGLIVRSQDDQDRRQVRLVLTDKGETLRLMFPPMEAAAMNEFTECLTTEELKCLMRLLGKMLSDTPSVQS